jgi:hypothetical protein
MKMMRVRIILSRIIKLTKATNQVHLRVALLMPTALMKKKKKMTMRKKKKGKGKILTNSKKKMVIKRRTKALRMNLLYRYQRTNFKLKRTIITAMTLSDKI